LATRCINYLMTSYKRPVYRKGFTLIELLVVIAIIGILASVVMASLNSARTKAKDAARIAEVKQLKTALELYYLDNGHYPVVGADGSGYPISYLSTHLTSSYIPTVPNDPDLASGIGWSYVRGPADAYGLRVYTEADGWCKTGANVNIGWWGATAAPLCDF